MYQVKFIDGVFQGDVPERSNWNSMPYKPIVSLTYRLLGKTLYLAGFEEYNHLVERSMFFGGQGQLITKVIILARIKEEVKRVVFDLQTRSIYNLKDSKYDNSKGWKKGFPTNQPVINIK